MPNAQQLSLELFFDTAIPPAPDAETRMPALDKEISAAMAQAVDECGLDRAEIARRMSETLGREVTKYMIDAYTAESKGAHNISLARAIAFDVATGVYALLRLCATRCGGKVYIGREALLAELGRAEVLRDELSTQIKRIKHQMDAAPARAKQ